MHVFLVSRHATFPLELHVADVALPSLVTVLLEVFFQRVSAAPFSAAMFTDELLPVQRHVGPEGTPRWVRLGAVQALELFHVAFNNASWLSHVVRPHVDVQPGAFPQHLPAYLTL